MLNGLLHQANLRLQAALGLDNAVVIFSIIAVGSAAAAMLFGSASAFLWLATRYDGITAGVILAGGWLAVSLFCLMVCLLRRRTITRRAQVALSKEDGLFSANSLLNIDPGLLLMALQISRSIGMRRLLPIAAVGFLAAMGSREWFGSSTHGRGQRA